MLYVRWNVNWCMGNATYHVSLRNTLCLSPFSHYMILCNVNSSLWGPFTMPRLNWTELNYLRTTNCQFNSVQCRRWKRAFTWARVLQRRLVDDQRCWCISHIAPPARPGQHRSSWLMNTNFKLWGVESGDLTTDQKKRKFYLPQVYLALSWRIISIRFGIRKLESRDYCVTFFVWSYD